MCRTVEDVMTGMWFGAREDTPYKGWSSCWLPGG